MSPVSAKRYKENNWRKGSRGRTELAVHLKTISTVVLAWMVIAQLHLLVNSVKMCLDAPSDWWTVEPEAEVKTAQSSVTKIQWKRWICKDHEPPKSSWRPRKSTKSWDQLSVQKFTKVTQSRKKVNRTGKTGPTEPRGVEGMYQNSRCASREKTWLQSTKKLNENWAAISLVFLSTVLRENCSSFRSTLQNFKPYYAFKRMELITPKKQG